MKKINLIMASSLAIMALTACGATNDPVPTSAPNNNNGAGNVGFEDPDMYLENQPLDGSSIPSEYYDEFTNYQWVLTYESGTNTYLLFYDDERWERYDIDYVECVFSRTDNGTVWYDPDTQTYYLDREDGTLYDTLTYDERGILYGTDCMYCNDVSVPGIPKEDQIGTAGSNYYANNPYAQYEGEWNEVWPDGSSNSYYLISADGDFIHYSSDVEDGSGYIVLTGDYDDHLTFYTYDGDKCFECTSFDEGIIHCNGWTMEKVY